MPWSSQDPRDVKWSRTWGRPGNRDFSGPLTRTVELMGWARRCCPPGHTQGPAGCGSALERWVLGSRGLGFPPLKGNGHKEENEKSFALLHAFPVPCPVLPGARQCPQCLKLLAKRGGTQHYHKLSQLHHFRDVLRITTNLAESPGLSNSLWLSNWSRGTGFWWDESCDTWNGRLHLWLKRRRRSIRITIFLGAWGCLSGSSKCLIAATSRPWGLLGQRELAGGAGESQHRPPWGPRWPCHRDLASVRRSQLLLCRLPCVHKGSQSIIIPQSSCKLLRLESSHRGGCWSMAAGAAHVKLLHTWVPFMGPLLCI